MPRGSGERSDRKEGGESREREMREESRGRERGEGEREREREREKEREREEREREGREREMRERKRERRSGRKFGSESRPPCLEFSPLIIHCTLSPATYMGMHICDCTYARKSSDSDDQVFVWNSTETHKGQNETTTVKVWWEDDGVAWLF
jgi:hypothetical protein